MQLVTVVSGARSTRHHHHNDQHHHHQVLALVSFPCLFSFNPIEPLTRGMFFRVHGVVGEVQHQHHHRPENGRSSCALGVQIIAACLTRVCKAQTAAHTDKKKRKRRAQPSHNPLPPLGTIWNCPAHRVRLFREGEWADATLTRSETRPRLVFSPLWERGEESARWFSALWRLMYSVSCYVDGVAMSMCPRCEEKCKRPVAAFSADGQLFIADASSHRFIQVIEEIPILSIAAIRQAQDTYLSPGFYLFVYCRCPAPPCSSSIDASHSSLCLCRLTKAAGYV